MTGADYADANKQRLACNGILAGVFENIDVLVCPSMTTPPGRVTPDELYGPLGEDDWSWGRFTIPFDFNGAPTISLPCGQDGDALPLSIQFVGNRLAEPLLCRMGLWDTLLKAPPNGVPTPTFRRGSLGSILTASDATSPKWSG